MKKVINNTGNQLKKRFRSDLFIRFIDKKTVPVDGLNIKHFFGGAILFLFIVQVFTGFLLQLHYVPTLKEAYKSIELLTSEVEFGWLIRSIHSWSAHLMVIFLLLHLWTAFISGSYRSPREITWISGCLMFALVLAICFFGYLLPWNERSFYATCAGMQIINKLPLIGAGMVNVVQGAGEFTETTLSRFSVFHTLLLPGIFFIVLVFHIYFIQVHGISEPPSWRRISDEKLKRRLPFFPDFFRRILIFWIILANVVILLALFFPLELGEEANRFVPAPLEIKPEWYFLFLYQTLKVMPATVFIFSGEILALSLVFFGAVFILLLPLFDKNPEQIRPGKLVRLFVLVFFIYIVTMTIWGFLD